MGTLEYVRPPGLGPALDLLARHGGRTTIIAGGTDLLVQQDLRKVEGFLLDVGFIRELRTIAEEDGRIAIGAGVTHAEVEASPLIQRHAPTLVAACAEVGGEQIQNRGTIGGNLVNASPAADSVPPLYTLRARVILDSRDGSREVPIQEFLLGPGRTVRRSTELITAVRFSKATLGVAFFLKLGQRSAQTISKASVALAAAVDSAGHLRDVRVSLGSVGPTVINARETAAFLEGKAPTKEVILEAARILQGEARPIDDIRSTQEYRRELVRALLFKGFLPYLCG